jgi:hypothetical protein
LGGNLKLKVMEYINNVVSGTGSNSTGINFTTEPVANIGGEGGESYFPPFNGTIKNLTITKG